MLMILCKCVFGWGEKITNKLIPIRMEPHEELLGADFVEHLVRRKNAGISPALSIVGSHPDIQRVVDEAALIGQSNPSKGKNYDRF